MSMVYMRCSLHVRRWPDFGTAFMHFYSVIGEWLCTLVNKSDSPSGTFVIIMGSTFLSAGLQFWRLLSRNVWNKYLIWAKLNIGKWSKTKGTGCFSVNFKYHDSIVWHVAGFGDSDWFKAILVCANLYTRGQPCYYTILYQPHLNMLS